MNLGIISVRYAKALFSLAMENSKINTIRNDMLYILELTSIKEVKELLLSPIIENTVKGNTLKALLKSKVDDLTMNFVILLVKNNREMFLNSMARSFIKSANHHNGVTQASLTTASEAGEKVKQSVIQLIEQGLSTKVELNEVIDPSITGGFVLKIEDTYIDGSVKTQLRKIEKELCEESF